MATSALVAAIASWTGVPSARAEPEQLVATDRHESGFRVQLGAMLPVFDHYATLGPTVGALWLSSPVAVPRLHAVMGGELAFFAIEGARRTRGTISIGGRYTPLPQLGGYVQGLVSATGYLERVKMDLGFRAVDSSGRGGGVVAEISLGWRLLQRFEVSLAWQQSLVVSDGLASGAVALRIGGAL